MKSARPRPLHEWTSHHAAGDNIESFREDAAAAYHAEPLATRRAVWFHSSTTLQVARVLHHLAAVHDKRDHSAAVFRSCLASRANLQAVHISTVPCPVTKSVATLLQDRRVQVAVKNAQSTERPIRACVLIMLLCFAIKQCFLRFMVFYFLIFCP